MYNEERKEVIVIMYLIVVYDIKQESNYAKRQRNVFKTCKKYLKHIQNSVFEGELDKSQYMEMTVEMKRHLKKDIDSCLVFSGRNNIWMKKEFITQRVDEDDQFV